LHLTSLYKKIRYIKKAIIVSNDIDTSHRKEDVVLQGCALIFSPKYIELFDGIDERTFLFNEEQLLYWRAVDNNLLTVYNPYILIYHNENASTNLLNKNSRKKEMFVIENELASTKILYEDLLKREEMKQ
jgi:GT2 family glycosyltransferase